MDAEARGVITRFFARRETFIREPSSFMGGWIHLFLTLLNPERHPPILWSLPNPGAEKCSTLFVAGAVPTGPGIIKVKNVNDQALLRLVFQMKQDKDSGLPSRDCGWVTCKKDLWTSGERATLEDARSKLTQLAIVLGKLEYGDARKKNLPHSGKLRLPEVWACPQAGLYVGKTK